MQFREKNLVIEAARSEVETAKNNSEIEPLYHATGICESFSRESRCAQ